MKWRVQLGSPPLISRHAPEYIIEGVALKSGSVEKPLSYSPQTNPLVIDHIHYSHIHLVITRWVLGLADTTNLWLKTC